MHYRRAVGTGDRSAKWRTRQDGGSPEVGAVNLRRRPDCIKQFYGRSVNDRGLLSILYLGEDMWHFLYFYSRLKIAKLDSAFSVVQYDRNENEISFEWLLIIKQLES